MRSLITVHSADSVAAGLQSVRGGADNRCLRSAMVVRWPLEREVGGSNLESDAVIIFFPGTNIFRLVRCTVLQDVVKQC